MTTTATGSREIPVPRARVWRALTQMTGYCAVCDVSYVYPGVPTDQGAQLRQGSRFLCVPGRLDGDVPPPDAVKGEVVEWVPLQQLGTRLELDDEVWWMGIGLSDAGPDVTVARISITYQSTRNRILGATRTKQRQRMVQSTVDAELAKLPDHIANTHRVGGPSVTSGHELRNGVLHLRGSVDAPAVERLKLDGCLDDPAVVEIDVAELAYLDSTGLPVLLRWARRVRGAGGTPFVLGENGTFDDLLAEMGLASAFLRRV